MSKSIRLSPKHGVNPTIPVCFFCGREKNEIALLGRLPGDAEAPRNAVLDYEPCEDCKAKMAMGYTLVGVLDAPPRDGMASISGNKYPSGNLVVLTEHGIRSLFDLETADGIVARGHQPVLMDDGVVRSIQAAQKPAEG